MKPAGLLLRYKSPPHVPIMSQINPVRAPPHPVSCSRSYQRTSPDLRHTYPFRSKASFYDEALSAPRPTPKQDHPLLVSCPRLLIEYSQLPSILKAFPPSATWRRAMPWWQGPTYHGYIIICILHIYYCIYCIFLNSGSILMFVYLKQILSVLF